MTTPRRTRFYFEHSPDEQAQPDFQNSIFEEEGWLAHEINLGRELVRRSQQPYLGPPDALGDAPEGERPEVYSDAISFILQAAVHERQDPQELCDYALYSQAVIRDQALNAAASRTERRSRPDDEPEPEDHGSAPTQTRDEQDGATDT